MWGLLNLFLIENVNVIFIVMREKLDKLLDILSGKLMVEYCLFILFW